MLTHLGNGMPNQVHRHNNPVMAGLAAHRLAATIITDGFHLPKAVVSKSASLPQVRGSCVHTVHIVCLACTQAKNAILVILLAR